MQCCNRKCAPANLSLREIERVSAPYVVTESIIHKPFFKGDLKDFLISASILLLAFEFSVVCKISVIFEIPIVVFKKLFWKSQSGKDPFPHLIALQIYALISAEASKTKNKLIINIYSLCVFSLNFFLSHALFVCVYFYSILFYSL